MNIQTPTTHLHPARLLLGALLIGLLAMTNPRADEWTGWRGVERAGHAARAVGPLHWSSTQNIRWKAAIPGRGHSSPIVTNDSVYLTTSRPLKGTPWRTIFGMLAIACGLCFFVFRIHRLALECKDAADFRRLAGLTGVMLLLLGFLFLLIFSEQIIDFDRTSERPWLGLALLGIFTLHLAGLFPARGSRAPLLAGVGLLLFAGVLALLAPDPSLLRNQPGNVQSIFYFTFIALAALVGLLDIGRYLAPARSGRLLRGATFAGIAAAVAALLAASFGQYRGILQGVSSWIYYKPPLPVWIALPGAALFLAAALARRRAGNTRAANLTAVIGAALFIVTLIFAGFGCALQHVLFISHLWGTPHWIPTPNNYGLPWPLPLGAVLAAMVTAGFFLAKSGKGQSAFARFLSVPLLVLFAAYALRPAPPLVARYIVAIDRATGRIRWTSQSIIAPRGIINPDNTPATPTPVTDGKHIYAYFGTAGVLCVNLRGRTVWTNRQLPFRSRMGVASSPILCDGKLIIDSESDAERYLDALNCDTGAFVWRTARKKRIHNYAGNCRTPGVLTIDGRKQIVVWGFEDISGYDPADGRELWSHIVGDLGQANNPVNSFVSDGKALYLLGISEAMKLDIAKLPTAGNPIVWWVKREEQRKRGMPGRETLPYNTQCSTPILRNGLLFAATDDGTAYCMDPATGKILWLTKIGPRCFSPPIAIGDRLYFNAIIPKNPFNPSQGRTSVIAAEPKFHLLGRNSLDGGIYATPAPVDGRLFIRTERMLYCIEEKGTGGSLNPDHSARSGG